MLSGNPSSDCHVRTNHVCSATVGVAAKSVSTHKLKCIAFILHNTPIPIEKPLSSGIKIQTYYTLVKCDVTKGAAGANLNAVSVDGETPLHWAINDYETASIKELLELVANPDRSDAYGITPRKLFSMLAAETVEAVPENREE